MPDSLQRRIAVDPQRSVIVQAPAGSGKTSLLVERYLGLLSVVDAPEEILAITFTRKAAAEMRERILQFLDPEYVPSGDYEQSAIAKARAAAKKVAEWELRDNPQRLMIRTIDSFSHYLARAMPVASQLGPVPTPAENTQALYRETARRVLSRCRAGDELAGDLEHLLLWRDNRSQYLEDLLVELLGRREQWLRALKVSGKAEQAVFENVVRDIVVERLSLSHKALEQGLSAAGILPETLLELLRLAAESLQAEDKASPLDDADTDRLPGSDPADLPGWKALGFALLTKDGNWLKAPNKNHGFPPKSAHKDGVMKLLECLHDNSRLASLIHRARMLPEPRYDDQEWEVLAALMRVLQASAAELELVFAASGQCDFTGIAQAALRGLGDAENGHTDLALYLDGQIRHILVDEYQDTNWGQYHLLEKLMAGWQPDEGRSLFLVGDPMQSIYRFREAEVGLFMHSRQYGIGQQSLEACQLTRNFRSASEIVTWVNQRLGPIFPKVENISAGAVSYAPSDPARGPGGKVETLAWPDNTAEAEGLARRISQLLEANYDNPDYKAAIIIRARSHLAEIVPALEQHGIAYRAVKLDPLLSRPVVLDLLALTRAIINPADISAVLAILRAPCCGLSLAQLHALTDNGKRILDAGSLSCLDADGQTRATRVFDVLERAQALWQRRSVRDLVEGAWSALGGPATLARPEAGQREAQAYLDALSSAEDQGLLTDWNAFIELLDKQHTEGEPSSNDVKLEILTMHGAKGLEWDLVVLPGLNRRPGKNSGNLLHWLPFTSSSGHENVLIAPLRSAEQGDNTRLIKLIQDEQKQRENSEMQRLLYVAATRARKHLLLSTTLDPNRADIKPSAGSLLAELWPGSSEGFKRSLKTATKQDESDAPGNAQPSAQLRRISADWQADIGPAMEWQPPLQANERTVEIEFDWAGIQARRIGTVLHRLLEHVGRIGIENFDQNQHNTLQQRIPGLLQTLGTGNEDLPAAAQLVEQVFEQAMSSKVGRWILSGNHREASCELPLSGIIDDRLVNAIIDRSFIDENHQRWIIDYKSGYHDGGDLEGFLDAEAKRYAPQLELYQRLFEQMGESNIQTALYLPRHDRLVLIGKEDNTDQSEP